MVDCFGSSSLQRTGKGTRGDPIYFPSTFLAFFHHFAIIFMIVLIRDPDCAIPGETLKGKEGTIAIRKNQVEAEIILTFPFKYKHT